LKRVNKPLKPENRGVQRFLTVEIFPFGGGIGGKEPGRGEQKKKKPKETVMLNPNDRVGP